MNNPVKVHQIWIGSDVPEREQKWITTIKEWCRNCNIEHKLWNIEELRKTFPDEPIWEFADTLPDNVRKWVLLADYFRFIVVKQGDMYLDTDFICTRAPWLDIESKYILAIGEYWNGRMAASGLICIGKQFNKLFELKQAVREQAKKLTVESLNDLCSALGPVFFRNTCNKLNLLLKIIPKTEASHIQWKNSGALIHQGAGSWCDFLFET